MDNGLSPVNPPTVSEPPPTDRPVCEALLTPGMSKPRPSKFRPLSSKSWIWLPEITPPDSPEAVSTLTAEAATVTSVVAEPTSKVAFKLTLVPGSTLIPVARKVLKPSFFIVTS